MNDIEKKAKELGVPIIPKTRRNGWFIDTGYHDPNPTVAICGECGREVKYVEGYSCGNGYCPIQPHAY